MKIILLSELQPADRIGCVCTSVDDGFITLWYEGDALPQNRPSLDPDAEVRAAFEAQQTAAKEAEFVAFKTRFSEKEVYSAYQEKLRFDEQAAYTAFKAANLGVIPKSAPPTLWQKTVEGTKSMLGMKGKK